MDQDSFRRLLEASRPSTSIITRGALGAASTLRSRLAVQPKKDTAEAVSKPAFKPRNIKKPEDVIDLELKVTQDKSTNVNNDVDVPQPHSKGLDLALLEQEKAKAGLLSTNDVDELEQAFAESSTLQTLEEVTPRRRTQEDLIRELKQRRSANAGQSSDSVKAAVQLDEAKEKGRFKPIGITSASKKRKDLSSNADKKKKRKVDNDKKNSGPDTASIMDVLPTKNIFEKQKVPADENFDNDFDIFAGAGEYTGVNIDENEEAETVPPQRPESLSSLPRRWIAMDEIVQTKPQTLLQSPIPAPEDAKAAPGQEGQEQPIRLAPLESSAVPSIKELLQIHDATDKYEKKMKRKEKKQKKRGGKGSDDD